MCAKNATIVDPAPRSSTVPSTCRGPSARDVHVSTSRNVQTERSIGSFSPNAPLPARENSFPTSTGCTVPSSIPRKSSPGKRSAPLAWHNGSRGVIVAKVNDSEVNRTMYTSMYTYVLYSLMLSIFLSRTLYLPRRSALDVSSLMSEKLFEKIRFKG